MPRPYSEDLRWSAVKAYETNEFTQAEIAENFGISLPSFCRFWKQYQETGDVKAKIDYHRGPALLLDEKGLARLKMILDKYPDATLNELSAKYYSRYKLKVSRSVLGRACQRLGLSRKKKSLYALEQERSDVKKSVKITKAS